MDRKYDVITLGEILLRLSTPINGRLAQGDTLMKHLGGAELNIASEIGQLGLKTAIISKIPNNLLAAFIKNQLNASRVSENYLIEDHSDDSRVGIYYYEYGSYPRKPRVVYDRKHSSINNIDIKDVPATMFYNTRLFHTSGITLGLGGNAQKFAIECIRKFKENGTLISFDVNYRANLWSGEEARKCIESILPYVDIFFCSADTARLTFGKTGTIEEIQKSFCEEYPISVVASTERTVITPKKHDFTSIIYSAKEDRYYSESPYNSIDVVDRIGSGDAYVSGALYGYLRHHDCQKMLEYGNAMAAIKHSVIGDMVFTDLEEIDGIIAQHKDTSGFQLVFIIFIKFRVQGLMQLPTALMIAVLIINRPFRGNSKKKIFRRLIIDKGMLSALLCHHVSSDQHGIYLRIAKRLYELFAPLSL